MIGILMLDTAFPRVPGDIGNPATFAYPVMYGVVPGATPEAIVRGPVAPWVQAFIAAGQRLVDQGCTSLTTTCGFLTLLRAEVAEATGVPVITSALELIPDLLEQKKAPAILTISARSLTPRHLSAAGVPPDTPIQGVDGGHFAQTILGNRPTLDIAQSSREILAGAGQLCSDHRETDVIVLECTNMSPYAEDITRTTGRDVVSIISAMDALQAGAV